jgi:hypothetical protein
VVVLLDLRLLELRPGGGQLCCGEVALRRSLERLSLGCDLLAPHRLRPPEAVGRDAQPRPRGPEPCLRLSNGRASRRIIQSAQHLFCAHRLPSQYVDARQAPAHRKAEQRRAIGAKITRDHDPPAESSQLRLDRPYGHALSVEFALLARRAPRPGLNGRR